MAQPFELDIFSEDIDVDAVSVKAPPVPPPFPYNILSTRRQKQWLRAELGKKKKNKPTKQVQNLVTPAPVKSNWQSIPADGGSNTTSQKGKKAGVKFGMDRPNLKVVDANLTIKTIQLKEEKPKEVTMQQPKTSSKPMEKKDVDQAVSNPAPNQELNKPQSLRVKGRIPASAFMNIDKQLQPKPSTKPPSSVPGFSTKSATPHPVYYNYPKGIPRSFLTQQQLQQIHQAQQPNLQIVTNPLPVTGPVWETKIPSAKTTAPVWTPVNQHEVPTDQYASNPGQMYGQEVPIQQEHHYAHSGPSGQAFEQVNQTFEQPMFVQTDSNVGEPSAQYSPSDVYADTTIPESNEELPGASPDSQLSGSKRLSAFKRLGPVTQPKKPKLTINLLVGKEQAVREVVDESENPDMDKYVPVLERPDIQTSLDDTVMKFISFWPWKKSLSVRRTISARESKHVMQLELEQMDEHYEKDKMFFGIMVTGYPESWNKEDVLDCILEAVKGKSFIPCFVEFKKHECKFLVIRSKFALTALHKQGLVYRKDSVVLKISIIQMNLSINQIDFIPRLILRKRLSMSMEGETELNLKQFTLAHDLSHFLYFPLSRVANQSELMQLQSSVPWPALTKLVLSHNKITTLSGFDLPNHTPKLKHLDLSFNRIEGITSLLSLRKLPLNCIVLEGNPLCSDYIQPERYMKVLKMMFSGLKEIDGVKLYIPGDFPPYKRNYSPPEAVDVTSKVLETMFPLLDADPDERRRCEDFYTKDAVMTVTFMYKLRYGPIYKDFRTLFSRARIMDEGEMDAIEGALAITKVMQRWPKLEHDPLTFTVDVIYHTNNTTMLRIAGIVKVTTETLAEDEHLLRFTRTLVLHSADSDEYKITNEMIYWDLPDKEQAREAFKMTVVRSKNLNLKLDVPPDEELREKLLAIFMKITDLERNPSKKCLEAREWHLRNAIEYFTKLLKQDNLDPLYD